MGEVKKKESKNGKGGIQEEERRDERKEKGRERNSRIIKEKNKEYQTERSRKWRSKEYVKRSRKKIIKESVKTDIWFLLLHAISIEDLGEQAPPQLPIIHNSKKWLKKEAEREEVNIKEREKKNKKNEKQGNGGKMKKHVLKK